ncbi:MAG: DNA polymerase III subunit gamma/tau [Paracoccaceae bacterium]
MSDYRVLARKYRPETFADLVGQDAMVTILRNAFRTGRIAQAFVLTGIRGTGKTTTARIIAKGLNCIGADGTGGPTTDPCGVCEHCVAIAEGRHVDVLEMDAASHTGVANIRETILETVSYRAATARYKVIIVDEVHMLSTSAFNALLKTLEEPPAHVKFILATTEIRKVPVTVLSRCQRFDLRRIEPEAMIELTSRIAQAEGAAVEADALALIARAAEGSARDATSLLDQAIGTGGDGAGGTVTAAQVREMLGLADRGRVLDLLDHVMGGRAAEALGELSSQYADGADPVAVLRDLAELVHWVSLVKITPEAADDPTATPDERARGRAMADALPMRVLTRSWQMLLKSLEEVGVAPNAMMAAEMAIIRLTHVADLPAPSDIVRKLRDMPEAGTAPAAPAGPPAEATGHAPPAPPRMQGQASPPATPGPTPAPALRSVGDAAPAPAPSAPATALAAFATFDDVVALIRRHRDIKLATDVEHELHLVDYAPGRIVMRPSDDAAPDLAPRLAARLKSFTGARWVVTIAAEGGAPTIAQARAAQADDLRARAEAHPAVQAVLLHFPQARVARVRERAKLREAAELESLPEAEEWDPFEDD